MADEPESDPDPWSRWVLHDRNGGNEKYEEYLRAEIQQYIDHLLARAQLEPRMTLLDIGTGNGAVAFRAIEQAGPSLRVILTDISKSLLLHTQARARALAVDHQCTFIECGAEELRGIADESVDVVTSRAALAYVGNKTRAIEEFRRVLKPGGRLCLAEPIFQDEAVEVCALRSMVERDGDADPMRHLLHRLKSAQLPDTVTAIAANPLTNFSERTLFLMLRNAGFFPISAQLHMDFTPSAMTSWDVFLHSAPHPLAPTPFYILETQFNAEERGRFESALRPVIESRRGTTFSSVVHIQATKPLHSHGAQ
jgi:arsenite methyltransferase